MLKVGYHRALRALKLLPDRLSGEINRLALGRRGGISRLREIRIRVGGCCSILLGEERIALFSGVTEEEMEAIVDRLTSGALYAHRDSIASGYISIGGGIRVGVCGRAFYENGRLVGVGDMCSLVFRIPTGECAFERELCEIFSSGIGSGMLIYSPPGAGKTTALRTLCGFASRGAHPMRVAVVDERLEFCTEDYIGCEVDILTGYKKGEGIEIATRTLSPDLIIIDEIGAGEAEELRLVAKCGIPMIATAHASSLDEIMMKPAIAPLIKLAVFSLLVGISCEAGEYKLKVDRV